MERTNAHVTGRSIRVVAAGFYCRDGCYTHYKRDIAFGGAPMSHLQRDKCPPHLKRVQGCAGAYWTQNAHFSHIFVFIFAFLLLFMFPNILNIYYKKHYTYFFKLIMYLKNIRCVYKNISNVYEKCIQCVSKKS